MQSDAHTNERLLRPFWARFFKLDWKLGLGLILLFGIPRFVLVLDANISGQYNLVSFIFLAMWFMPAILLSKHGRRGIGLKRPTAWSGVFIGLLLGLFGSAFLYFFW